VTDSPTLRDTAARLVSRILDPAADSRSRPAPTVPDPGGVFLGWGPSGYVIGGPEQHALVLGPPRSGKTTRLLRPSVLRHQGPAVVTSTKSDVLHMTIAARSRLGQCWYWDPSGTTVVPAGCEPLAWSPVVDCEHWDQAVQRAHALTSAARPDPSAHDAHWVERAQALLAPLLHAAALSGAKLATVLSWLHKRELTPAHSLLKEHDANRAADILEGLTATDSRELSGIFSTADSVLAAYRSDAALAGTRNPTFDPDTFAASKDTVYLVAPAASQSLMAPLVVALLDQIRSAVYRWGPRPPMLYALDEVANIAPLPDLPSTLAEGGSQGLLVLACLQDLSQARTRWGRAAEGFLTLFTHKLLLPGVADPATLKAVTTLAGHVDVPVRSRTNGWHQSSTSWTTRRQPRLPEDQAANLPAGTALLVSGSAMGRVAI
jgi:type IV secretion system protein VirD4